MKRRFSAACWLAICCAVSSCGLDHKVSTTVAPSCATPDAARWRVLAPAHRASSPVSLIAVATPGWGGPVTIRLVGRRGVATLELGARRSAIAPPLLATPPEDGGDVVTILACGRSVSSGGRRAGARSW